MGKPWDRIAGRVTDPRFVFTRREALGLLSTAIGAARCRPAFGDDAPAAKLYAAPPGIYPAKKNARFVVKERGTTPEALATGYNNFYEFTTDKEDVKNRVGRFPTDPWSVEVTGLVKKPKTFALDEIVRGFSIEERIYRFRCVEAWSMTVPWSGFPLRRLLDQVEPLQSAKYVRFVSFKNEAWAPGQAKETWYPWPYFEALTIEEATHELTLVVTGAYGKDLSRQAGAPIRIIVPWKYGYKSPKSIVRIELVEKAPHTFWNDLAPSEYGFYSNVDPTRAHPRWSQRSERLIDTGERILTQAYNGYGEWVASLYPSGKTYF